MSLHARVVGRFGGTHANREVLIRPTGSAAALFVPPESRGLVLFAHGSGRAPLSPAEAFASSNVLDISPLAALVVGGRQATRVSATWRSKFQQRSRRCDEVMRGPRRPDSQARRSLRLGRHAGTVATAWPHACTLHAHRFALASCERASENASSTRLIASVTQLATVSLPALPIFRGAESARAGVPRVRRRSDRSDKVSMAESRANGARSTPNVRLPLFLTQSLTKLFR